MLRNSRRAKLVVIPVLLAWLGAPAPAQGRTVAETAARIDELHKRRDDPAALAEERRMADEASAAPGGGAGPP